MSDGTMRTSPRQRVEPAGTNDLQTLMDLVAAVIADMQLHGIDQWDAVYPDHARIAQDLAEGTAWIVCEEHVPIALIVLNTVQDEQYQQPIWQGMNPAVVHRLMVHPGHQGRGLARRLMVWAEDEAWQRGFDSIRLDAFTRNPASMRLYPALGYQHRGFADFRKGRFALFEKMLDPV